EDSYSPMFIKYCDKIEGNGVINSFTLNYSIQGISSFNENFIIYNEEELEQQYSSITTTISDGYPQITFTGQVPNENFTVIYGVKSPYNIGYGFQKEHKPYSNSIRLIRNNEASQPIINKDDNSIESTMVEDPSLFIGLDNSQEVTTIEIQSIPLLYAPEINISFILDPIIINQIKRFNSFETLKISTEFVTNDGQDVYFNDLTNLVLDYQELQDDLNTDGSYSFIYNKDLQALYEMLGPNNFDIRIRFSQTGKIDNSISYLIISKIEYLCDDHIFEMYDVMPTKNGKTDYASLINTNHFLSITGTDFFTEPFNLLHDSEITVGLNDLPNSTLVNLKGGNQGFNYLGSSETYQLSQDNPYGFENLGMFTDLYNLNEEVVQDGYINLFYGDGTESNGERYLYTTHNMESIGTHSDYGSYIDVDNGINYPISWEDQFEVTNKFLTTSLELILLVKLVPFS
ncbi:MAG: hypothetical protein P8Y97_15540, partial [Candidatus Lokiarchaeota archaeon]